MTQVIKNIGQFAKALEPKIRATLELVAEDVKREIDDTLGDYYDEHSPIYYKKRTSQLKNCCKIGKPKISNGKISIEVYLDIDSLNYNTPGADPYKTVVAGASGLHGGWDISTMEQIPWSTISSNDGTSYGDGTQIWEEPMQELIDNGKLVAIFKKCAQQRGLNLK